jgi:hypothetical protein
MSNIPLCPVCVREMVRGKQDRYQTLDEHICCPEREPPRRDAWVCDYSSCVTNQLGLFWAEDGEGPYNAVAAYRQVKWVNDNPCPFNTPARAEAFRYGYHAEDKTYYMGKLSIQKEVRYTSNDFGDKVGRKVNYSLYWNNCHYTPGITMFFFCLKMLYRRSLPWREEDIKNICKQRHWPRAEWWRKALYWWVNIFHHKVVKQVSCTKGKD